MSNLEQLLKILRACYPDSTVGYKNDPPHGEIEICVSHVATVYVPYPCPDPRFNQRWVAMTIDMIGERREAKPFAKE